MLQTQQQDFRSTELAECHCAAAALLLLECKRPGNRLTLQLHCLHTAASTINTASTALDCCLH